MQGAHTAAISHGSRGTGTSCQRTADLFDQRARTQLVKQAYFAVTVRATGVAL